MKCLLMWLAFSFGVACFFTTPAHAEAVWCYANTIVDGGQAWGPTVFTPPQDVGDADIFLRDLLTAVRAKGLEPDGAGCQKASEVPYRVSTDGFASARGAIEIRVVYSGPPGGSGATPRVLCVWSNPAPTTYGSIQWSNVDSSDVPVSDVPAGTRLSPDTRIVGMFAKYLDLPPDKLTCWKFGSEKYRFAAREKLERQGLNYMGAASNDALGETLSDKIADATEEVRYLLGTEPADKTYNTAQYGDDKKRRDGEYAYCVVQSNDAVERKSFSLVSGVFAVPQGPLPIEATNDWTNYATANYDVVGDVGRCFKEKTRAAAISARDHDQASFRQLYGKVIATGWTWHKN